MQKHLEKIRCFPNNLLYVTHVSQSAAEPQQGEEQHHDGKGLDFFTGLIGVKEYCKPPGHFTYGHSVH